MDIQTIEGLMRQAEEKFNTLNTFQEEVKAKLKELGLSSYEEVKDEMNRLQGDFRSLDTVRTQLGASATPEPATVIDAEPTLKEEAKNAKRTSKSKSS